MTDSRWGYTVVRGKVSSIRWRFVVTAFLLAALALPAVFYTQNRFQETSHASTLLVQEHRDLGWVLNSLKDSLQVTESAIYRYPLLLDERSYRDVLVRLAETKFQSTQLEEHYVVGNHRRFSDFAANLNFVLARLDEEINNLVHVLSDVQTRFPAAPILINKMYPTNQEFTAAIEVAIQEATENPRDRNQQRILKLLQDLRYAWSQQVSSVRIFVANRSGVFGEPESSMMLNKTNRDIYAQQVDDYLVQLHELLTKGRLGFEQTQSLEIMRQAKIRYDEDLQEAEKIYMSKDWRADMPLLRERIRPVLDQAWGIVELMQEELDELAQQNLMKSLATADTLSNVIWIFAGFMMVLLFIAYILFEYIIRRPLYEVSKALDAAGRGENYIPILVTPTQETLTLVEAFRNMQGQVHSRQVRLESILDNAAEGIITVDESGVIETFNNAAQKLFGYTDDQVLGKSIEDIVRFPTGKQKTGFLDLCKSSIVDQEDNESIVTVMRGDGSHFPMSLKANELTIEGRLLYIAIVEDIGDRLAMMEHLREMAEHDSLTGLYNRQYFLTELERVVENVRRGGQRRYALLYIDLDNFKYVNDTLGHVAGDRVLVEVTEMLSHRNRKSDLLVRLGGDEFAILIYDANEEHVIQAANAHRKLLADYIFKYEGNVVQVGCSIGVTMFGDRPTSKEELLVQADIACHVAKRSGRNRVHLFESNDQKNMATMSEDMGWAARIKDAIERDRFCLAVQPIMELKSGEILRQEVLLRLKDEEGGLILPAGFLSSAERFGLMRTIDKWVVNKAIEYLGAQLKKNPKLHFSINLSAESVGDQKLLDIITSSLIRHEVPPTAITFEITETVAIANLDAAVGFLNQLREHGCQTALDDFGVGYSSFAYLKDLPVDFVKIDGSFVRDIYRDKLQLAMVRSMNEIAHAMGKYTIAEFVHNQECMDVLREMKVDYIQGYHVGGPKLIETDTLFETKSNVIQLVQK
ncbi:putative bifunctional diguanylate cyclase/phosphodiesterase [Kaarinaea lacus]